MRLVLNAFERTKIKSINASCLSLLIIAVNTSCVPAQNISAQQNKEVINQFEVETESLNLLDETRNREIPVALYSPTSTMNMSGVKRPKLKLAIVNHGYGGKNTEYTFIAKNLVTRGYFVASVQHELPSDEPLSMTGNLYETRKPNWERGVQNILFVVQELKRIKPDLDFKDLLLVGHSNGGDMAMLFAKEHPKLVRKIISLDNRRVPFPRTRKPQILSLRSSDQAADAGVLPTEAEREKFGVKIIKLNDTLHNDMWDGATEKQKQKINQIISDFLLTRTKTKF